MADPTDSGGLEAGRVLGSRIVQAPGKHAHIAGPEVLCERARRRPDDFCASVAFLLL